MFTCMSNYSFQVLGLDYKQHLLLTLYPLIEKLGNPSLKVCEAAFSASNSICKACQYR